MKTFSEYINKNNLPPKNKLDNESLAKISFLKRRLTKEQVDKIFNDYIFGKDKKDFETNFIIDVNGKYGLNNMLKDKGIDKLGPIKNGAQYILKLFKENDNISKLKEILNNYNNGKSPVHPTRDESSEDASGKDFFSKYCEGWKDEASELAELTYSSGSVVGPFEILLKFIFKDIDPSASSGDVSFLNNEEMEVKCMTWSKSKSGGHMAGQKSLNGQKIRRAWSIDIYLNDFLFSNSADIPYKQRINNTKWADNSRYFQTDNGFKNFKKLLKDNNIDINVLANTLVKAICFQYDFIDSSRDENNLLSTEINSSDERAIFAKQILNKLIVEVNKALGNNIENISYTLIKQIIGYVQLHLYAIIENFDYLFIGILCSHKKHRDSHNGRYCFFNFTQSNPKTFVKSFDDINKLLSFGALEKTDRGRTGKIYLK